MDQVIEGAVYLSAVALFSFVLIGAARMKHEWMLLGCIPPVFMALVMGFIMVVYSWSTFGPAAAVAAIAVPVPLAWRLSARYSSKDLLISIYLACSVAMVLSLVAFQFPDRA